MLRLIAYLVIALSCALPICGQSFTTITSSNIADAGGSPLAAGLIHFVATDGRGHKISFNLPGGGQGLVTSVDCDIAGGSIVSASGGGTCKLANTSLTTPANICYQVSITDNVTGEEVQGPGYSCYQPIGYTNSFDTYTPNLVAILPVQSGPTGATGAPGPTGAAGPPGGSLSYPGVVSDGVNGLVISGEVSGGGLADFPSLPIETNEYAFGDSQTYGVNNGSPQPSYTDGSGRLLPQYRWVNLYSQMDGRNLTVNNFAVGGTKISWTPGGVSDESVFNTTGNLDYNWSGVALVMAGWNNLGATTTSTGFFQVMEQAHRAMIARLLIDDYAGIGVTGCDHTGAVCPAYGWTTNGTDDSYTVPVGQARNYMPFYTGNTSAPRSRTSLTGTQSVNFALTSKTAIALFYETTTDGGAFTVSVNGSLVASGNSLYQPAGTDDDGQYPGVVWIEAPAATANVTFQANVLSGHVKFIGYGWVDSTGSLVASKKIIYGTVSGNQANGRTPDVLYSAAKGAAQAVAYFNKYPVYLSDDISNWVEATDQEPTDISHFTDVGNIHIAQSFRYASKGLGNDFSFRSSFLPPYSIQNAGFNTWFFRDSQAGQGTIPLARFVNKSSAGAFWDAFDDSNNRIGSVGRYLNGMYMTSYAATGGAIYLQHDSGQFVGIGPLPGLPARKLELSGADPFLFRIGDGQGTNIYDFGRDSSTGLLNIYGGQTGFNGMKVTGIDGDILTATKTLFQVNGMQVTSTAATVGGDLVVQPLVGSGNVLACLDSTGKLYRGTATTCP